MEQIIQIAIDNLKNSYSPYSNVKVSACLKMKDGSFITGTNIENASYELTICAERCAIFKAISEGFKGEDIVSLALVSNKGTISPCGACRQVLSEFLSPDCPIIMADQNGENISKITMQELLPLSFKKEDIE